MTNKSARRVRLRSIWTVVAPQRSALLAALVLVAMSRAAGLVLPVSVQFLLDGVSRGDLDALRMLAPLLAFALVATSLAAVLLGQVLGRAGSNVVYRLRCRLCAHVLRLPIAYFDRTKTGELVSRILSDVEGARNFVSTALLDVVGWVVTGVASVVVLMNISVSMTIPVIAVCLIDTVLVRFGLKRLHAIYMEQRRAAADLSGRLVEGLGGVRVVKTCRAEQRQDQVFARAAEHVMNTTLRSVTLTSLIDGAGTLSFGIMALFVLFRGINDIQTGALTVGAFVTFSMVLPMLSTAVQQLGQVGARLTAASATMERTLDLLAMETEDADARRTHTLDRVDGYVVFDDVSFAYGDGPRVLNGVDFEAAPGSVTALVGASGAGKSTIAAILAAFYNPTGGRVLVDGADLSGIRLDSYRRHVALVLQDPFLFEGTIRDNVLLAAPDATQAEFLEACRAANIDEFAERLPDGYDTLVGERGVRLSGGQKQRLAIARAIVTDTQILIFDEATSNLDGESEMRIQLALKRVLKGRTTFIIAHRIASVRYADQILVLQRGQLVERGRHESLVQQRGRYYDLSRTQQAEGVSAAVSAR